MRKTKRIKPTNYMNKVHRITKRQLRDDYENYEPIINDATSNVIDIKDINNPKLLSKELRMAAGTFYISRNLAVASLLFYMIAETYILTLVRY